MLPARPRPRGLTHDRAGRRRHDPIGVAPITYIADGSPTSPKFASAFADGCGGTIAHVGGGLRDGDFAAFCTPATWPVLAAAQRLGRTWYYGDHAYFKRGRYYRITRNAVQYVPTPAALAASTPDRYRACYAPEIQPWRADGDCVVICPNADQYMAHHGLNAHDWTLDVVRQVAAATTRNIIVRWKAQAKTRPLFHDLHTAWAVVVFSSNAAVEALATGVPVFVLAPWASTAAMGSNDLTRIDDPVYPADDLRRHFLWALAEHQWTVDEIRDGLAWKVLQM